MLGSNFTDTVFELSKYMSYVFLRNDMNLKTPANDLMYSLGDVTKTIECDKRRSNIYAIIWNAYMYQNKKIQFNCSQHQRKCKEFDPSCFEISKLDKTCYTESVMSPPCKDDYLRKAFFRKHIIHY